ncbi:hypothetical protein MPSEU_000663800 [Mayamaea pseudoterrestris]|nr:hypothetical protein MPSEU_000663800 [Mayamaea pseudoterrestris]
MSLLARFAHSVMPYTARLFSASQLQQPSSCCNLFSGVFCLALRGKHTIKTNRSIAKRFRVRGDGSLKRMKSGVSHNTGHRSRSRNNRLGQSTTISNNKMAAKMKQCMGIF